MFTSKTVSTLRWAAAAAIALPLGVQAAAMGMDDARHLLESRELRGAAARDRGVRDAFAE